jgi:hypothetical protein
VQWLGGVIAVRAITNRPLPTLEDVPHLVEMTIRGILVDEDSPAGRRAS